MTPPPWARSPHTCIWATTQNEAPPDLKLCPLPTQVVMLGYRLVFVVTHAIRYEQLIIACSRPLNNAGVGSTNPLHSRKSRCDFSPALPVTVPLYPCFSCIRGSTPVDSANPDCGVLWYLSLPLERLHVQVASLGSNTCRPGSAVQAPSPCRQSTVVN